MLAAAINGLEGFLVREPTDRGPVRRLEACQSPVWDTCLAVTALLDAGAAPDDPPLVAAGQWLVAEEIRTTGDWAVRRPDLEPSGWAFEFANDIYPDVDDAAEVVLSLSGSPPSSPAPTTRSPAAPSGRSACSRATAAGRRSTPTTPAG